MKIQYMFNYPTSENVYIESQTDCENSFGDTENISRIIINKISYSESVINKLKNRLNIISKVSYKGEFERLSRLLYTVEINGKEYEIAFIYDSLESKIKEPSNIQLCIEVETSDIDDDNFETIYNIPLETLKISLKDIIRKDWKLCTWLQDDQSELLCSNVYHKIFRIENKFREFANRVLIHRLGYNWLESPGLEKYRDSVKRLEGSFKQFVPPFANINSTLLSMTLETLSEVVLKAKLYKEDTTFNCVDMQRLLLTLSSKNIDSAKQILQNKRKVSLSIWDDIFKECFDAPEDFKNMITQFINLRNHIAHNKLLTFSVYNKINSELDDFSNVISVALDKYETLHPSEELETTWIAEAEAEVEEEEYLKSYLNERIYSETGVYIRNGEEIYELFLETANNLSEILLNRFHYDDRFDDIVFSDPIENDTNTIFKITNVVSSETLKIEATISIDDDMGSQSEMILLAVHNDEIISSLKCTYNNGSGYENYDTGLCEAENESVYDDTGLKDFQDKVLEHIDCNLNPILDKMEILKDESTRNGAKEPVGDFPCDNCGKYTVSINEDFFPIGKCCYCGYENELHVCKSCGCYYTDMGGNEEFCNGCLNVD